MSAVGSVLLHLPPALALLPAAAWTLLVDGRAATPGQVLSGLRAGAHEAELCLAFSSSQTLLQGSLRLPVTVVAGHTTELRPRFEKLLPVLRAWLAVPTPRQCKNGPAA